MQRCIMPALQTEGEKPEKAIKNRMRGIETTENLLRFLTKKAGSARIKVKCMPETATICDKPAARKA